ncbi:MAG: hypothetical protein RJQ08_08500 [Salinisphaeraceae bacterium]
MGAAEAITTLTALTTLALRSAEAAQRVSTIIQQAQMEDRDLTADEAREIQGMREAAMQRWNDAKE